MKRIYVLLLSLFIVILAHAQIKVLGIGNSFSVDALEYNLSAISVSESVPMIIGNLHIGGCSIDTHWANIENNLPNYGYTKFDEYGNRTTRVDVTIESVLCEENWDYISVQQVSGLSGIYDTYVHLGNIVEWLRAKAPNAKILLHQTWAYSPTSDHWDFPRYASSQERMYTAICDVTARIVSDFDIDGIIPSGSAIQNLREMTKDFDLTRDGYHLSLGMGRYTVACVWYGIITGKNITKISYYPDFSDDNIQPISFDEAKLCRKAARKASRYFKISGCPQAR